MHCKLLCAHQTAVISGGGQRGVVKSNARHFILVPHMFDLLIGVGSEGWFDWPFTLLCDSDGSGAGWMGWNSKGSGRWKAPSLIQSDLAFLSAKMSNDNKKPQHTNTHTTYIHASSEWRTLRDISLVQTGPASEEISMLASEHRAWANR